ncbi:FecCD family ABC transporter permease [Paludibacterium paludis]|uniref:Iron-siderophore ABC transporter permease n=1 Tax=Paludibacterium paludis TaxID=1225769 RepID=A0A918UAL0_9NEIS|nr:iron ABC transporter permease [Paludibacterium paludis]GGY22691.1 iron-siderophore ABC transporter permease [Paludibacterium paludis]
MSQTHSLPGGGDLLARHYRKLTLRRTAWLVALAALITISVALDFTLGPAGLTTHELWQALSRSADGDAMHRIIVWDIRLPYALLAVAIGMALGLAGAEMQTVLNNPLASPFTLGLSSAAAFGASLAMVLGLSLPGVAPHWVISVNAFVFAMLSALLLDGVARFGRMSTSGVVLFGIAMVFSFNALVSLIQFVASPEALQGLVFWTMGNLSRASWQNVSLVALAVALLLPLAMRDAWRLTALRLGEERAESFGIDIRRQRLVSLLRISLLAAVAVAFAGTIGFIGLVAPHMARRLVGEDHRFYLPAATLTGGAVLSLASVASKNLVPGIVIPVGIVTSLVGIPCFLMIIFAARNRA